MQDIEAHLLGDIPKADIDALQYFWDVCPNLKSVLFAQAKRSANYVILQVAMDDIKKTIFEYPEFAGYMNEVHD